jgi:hypothetical protein
MTPLRAWSRAAAGVGVAVNPQRAGYIRANPLRDVAIESCSALPMVAFYVLGLAQRDGAGRESPDISLARWDRGLGFRAVSARLAPTELVFSEGRRLA